MIDKIKKHWNEISITALVAATVVIVGVVLVELITKYYDETHPLPDSVFNVSLNNTVVITGKAFDCFGCLPIMPLIGGVIIILVIVATYFDLRKQR